jgi:protein phosphatase
MRFESFGLSDVGRVRQENEDSSGLFPDGQLFVVADGMGGHAGGKQASQLAVDTVGGELDLSAKEGRSDRLVTSIQEANRRIFTTAAADATLKGMGTTLVALLVTGDDEGVIAYVGDSRAYRLRAGKVEQLTVDHSLIADLIRRNEISEEEARRHPYRHVLTRALGVEEGVKPDVVSVDLKPDDVYVLCSDGVYGMIQPGDLERRIVAGAASPEELSRSLIEAANAGGGKDNATVVVVRCIAD